MKVYKLYLSLFLFENIFGQIYANRHGISFRRGLQVTGKCKDFPEIECSSKWGCPGKCEDKAKNAGDVCNKNSDCKRGKCIRDKDECLLPTKYCGDSDEVCKRDSDCRVCSAQSPNAGSSCKKHKDCVKGVGRCLRNIKCKIRESTPTNAPFSPPTNAPVSPTNAPISPTNAPVSPTNAPVSPTNAPVSPTNAPVSPTNAPVSPTRPPTLAPTPPFSPVKTGKSCTSNTQCESNYCEPSRNICYETTQCKAIKHDQGAEFDKNHAIILFVGSGFTNLNDWATKVQNTNSVFESYDFFKAGVTQFSSFYVNQLESSFCYFNCAGIDRLLCCDVNKARTLGSKCFPAGATVQTVVVHNDVKYGGAGYIGSNLATTSINSAAPLVAVHELGHSMFEFYDEYTYISGTPSSASNCDINAGCPKWNDIINDYPNICTYKGCASGNYYVGESSSFMKALNYNVGPVLTRYTCCTYYAITGTVPPYCNEFINKGMGLYTYCTSSGYSPDASLLAQGQGLGKTSFETPGGQKIYIANPAEISINVENIEASTDETFKDAMPSSPQHLQPAFYPSSVLDGENDNIEYMVQIKVTFVSGEVKVFHFSKFDVVSVPPSENDGVDSVHVKKDTINIVYDYDEYGDVASIEVRNDVA